VIAIGTPSNGCDRRRARGERQDEQQREAHALRIDASEADRPLEPDADERRIVASRNVTERKLRMALRSRTALGGSR
jgi:hypothetical protein